MIKSVNNFTISLAENYYLIDITVRGKKIKRSVIKEALNYAKERIDTLYKNKVVSDESMARLVHKFCTDKRSTIYKIRVSSNTGYYVEYTK